MPNMHLRAAGRRAKPFNESTIPDPYKYALFT
jgi:hypothetical protein